MKIKKFESLPSFSDEEAEAIKSVLLSNKVNYWTGDECSSFEKEFAKSSGVDYSIALANGTLALEVALRALDIGSGDEVMLHQEHLLPPFLVWLMWAPHLFLRMLIPNQEILRLKPFQKY